jgi:hypothetical protein
VGGWYYYYVDATNVYGRYYPHYFSFVTAGLESYDSTAHVLAFQDSALAYTTNGGGWKNWAGEDSTGMDGGVMCGHWVSATNWQAGEHSTPC